MKSILPDALPRRVMAAGRIYRIRPTLARTMLALDALKEESLAERERLRLFVWLMFRFPRPRGRYLLPAVEAALDALREEEPYPMRRICQPILDLNQDADLICAAFRQQYGIDLIKEADRLEWNVFLALLSGISPETVLGRIIGIRAAEIPTDTKANRAANAELRRLKAVYAIRREKASDDSFESGLREMAILLSRLAEEGDG